VKPNSAFGTTLGSGAAGPPAEHPSLADLRRHESFPVDRPAVPVFFLSDSTGISAETMGNALLIQFPFLRFDRRLIPFINSLEEARRVVAILDAAMDGPVTPLAFTTAAVDEIRIELHRSRCPIIDCFELHMAQVESILQARGERVASQLHGVGDLKRYNGDGIGSGWSLVIYIVFAVVLMFTIPNEIKNMYDRDGRQSPVSAIWGLWFLLPIIGHIIWYVKVQNALNDFWLSKGAQPG